MSIKEFLVFVGGLLIAFVMWVSCMQAADGYRLLPTATTGPQPATAVIPTITPSHGAYTETPTRSAPTPTETLTIQPTPTQETLSGLMTASPSLTIVTPLPVPTRPGEKVVDIIGVFTPSIDMNIRSCAAAIPACYTGESLLANERVQFYAMVTVYPSGEIWLCLDAEPDGQGGLVSQCKRLVAYIIGGKKYGSLKVVVPDGL